MEQDAARKPGPEDEPTMSGIDRIHYPESDGEPLGETPIHVRAMLGLLQALDWLYRDRPDHYVGSDMMLYYEEGVPSSCVSPDVFVALGPDRRERRVFKLWEEPAGPYLVIELTSKSSRLDDLGKKRAIYEMLGVSEYVVFDPLEEYLVPRFQAMRLVDGELTRVVMDPEAEYRIPALGLALVPEGAFLRVRDLATGKLVPQLEEATREAEEARVKAEEARAKAEDAEAKAEEERRRRVALEEELARVLAERAASRGTDGKDSG